MRPSLFAFVCIALAAATFRAAPAAAACDGGTKGSAFVVTDREPAGDAQLFTGERGIDKERRPILTYGIVRSPVSPATFTNCGSQGALLDALRQQFDPKRGRTVLVYVHGYYTSFKAAASDGLALATSLKFPGPTLIYSWPSKVTSRIAYVNDESNAQWSLSHLRALLGALEARFPNMPIAFAAHSLGSRLATEGLAYLRYSGCGACAGRVVLYAPDVDGQTLHDELVELRRCDGPPPKHPTSSAPVLLYVSNRDVALQQSQQIHGHQRAGQAASEIIICKGTDTVDVGYHKVKDRAGHTYQTDPAVEADARAAFAGYAPTSPQRKLRQVSRPAGIYYELRP